MTPAEHAFVIANLLVAVAPGNTIMIDETRVIEQLAAMWAAREPETVS